MMSTMKFSKMGVTVGMYWGVSLLFLAYVSLAFGVGAPIVVMLGSLYHGYAVSLVGGLIGFVLGFVHGYFVGVLGNFAMKYVK